MHFIRRAADFDYWPFKCSLFEFCFVRSLTIASLKQSRAEHRVRMPENLYYLRENVPKKKEKHSNKISRTCHVIARLMAKALGNACEKAMRKSFGRHGS